jgi:magnesium chelatase subunit ChlI-like protein
MQVQILGLEPAVNLYDPFKLPAEGQSLLQAAMTQLNLSTRVYYRILRLARTIADLAGCEEIQSTHLVEMLHAHLHCNKRSAAQVSQSSQADEETTVARSIWYLSIVNDA